MHCVAVGDKGINAEVDDSFSAKTFVAGMAGAANAVQLQQYEVVWLVYQ
jgi:hypothetical protein